MVNQQKCTTYLKIFDYSHTESVFFNREWIFQCVHWCIKKYIYIIKQWSPITCHLSPVTMTHDTWHMTRDMWHVTRDTWHVTRWGGWTFSQNFSSLALTVCVLCYYEDMEKKAHWLNNLVNQSISDEAVYRTAPATPNLLLKDHAKFIDLNEKNKVTIFPQF